MPEPRYRLVQARQPNHAGSFGDGWCWSVFDARTGRSARIRWVYDFFSPDTVEGRRTRVERLVEDLNAGRTHWHDITWEKENEIREVEDADA